MKALETITRRTPVEKLTASLRQTLSTGGQFEEFLATKGNPFSKQELLDFFDLGFVQADIKKYWNYERGPVWKDRSTITALEETIGHSMTNLAGEAEFVIAGKPRTDQLPEFQRMSPAEAIAFKQKALLLNDYLLSVLP